MRLFEFQSREHRINYLLKKNRECVDKILVLLREIRENEIEIVRLYREVLRCEGKT